MSYQNAHKKMTSKKNNTNITNLYSISAVFNDPVLAEINSLQERIIKEFPQLKKKKSNFIHLSFHATSEYYPLKLKNQLEEISAFYHRFEINTSGIGIFNKDKYVIYLPVIKTKKLLTLQKQIFNVCEKVNPSSKSCLYNPNNWVPHLSLFYDIKDHSLVLKALEKLIPQNLNFTLTLKNITYLYKEEHDEGFKFCIYLK